MPSRHIRWHRGDTIWALAARYHAEEDSDLRLRWQALWLLHRGYTREEVADQLDINPRTLRDWLAWYRVGGCAEVARHRAGGRQGQPRRLTVAQEQTLVDLTKHGQFHTIGEVQQWVAETWQIHYSYWGMRSLLDRHQIHAKVPRPRAQQADVALQEAWKKGA